MPDQLPIATVRIWYDSVIEKYFVNKVKFPASSTPSSLIRLLHSPSSSNSSVLTYLLTYLLEIDYSTQNENQEKIESNNKTNWKYVTTLV